MKYFRSFRDARSHARYQIFWHIQYFILHVYINTPPRWELCLIIHGLKPAASLLAQWYLIGSRNTVEKSYKRIFLLLILVSTCYQSSSFYMLGLNYPVNSISYSTMMHHLDTEQLLCFRPCDFFYFFVFSLSLSYRFTYVPRETRLI